MTTKIYSFFLTPKQAAYMRRPGLPEGFTSDLIKASLWRREGLEPGQYAVTAASLDQGEKVQHNVRLTQEQKALITAKAEALGCKSDSELLRVLVQLEIDEHQGLTAVSLTFEQKAEVQELVRGRPELEAVFA